MEYRIPLYVITIFLQFIGFIDIINRDNRNYLSRFIKELPLFFDHISTLPLPFSKKILRQISLNDKAFCAESLFYLLDKTHQHKVTAEFFEEFHGIHQEFLFAYLYKIIQNENHQILSTLNQSLNKEHPVGKLIHSYYYLCHENSRLTQLECHTDIIKKFSAKNYRYANELALSYDVLGHFAKMERLQELAQADQLLIEILELDEEDLLNRPLHDLFRLIAEMANDLKNYEIVENFRDKQYFLSEGRIKLYEISRNSQETLYNPEQAILFEIMQQWEEIIISASKTLRAPADLQIALLTKNLLNIHDWNSLAAFVKNVGQSPAENIRIALLENENLLVMESVKHIGLLGTGEAKEVEFFVKIQGNADELRVYFDAMFDDFERKDKLRPFADIVSLTATVKEFIKIPNPFVAGIPIRNEKVFFGRKDVLNFAAENLHSEIQHNVLVFFGQRRIGKSSILYRLMEEPQIKRNSIFVYLDCQGFGDVDTAKLLHWICNKIYSETKKYQLALESPNSKKFQANPFTELDTYIDQVEAALEEQCLVLLFDEYEVLEYKVKDGKVSREIFNKLRNLMQHRQKIAFIFAGTHRLTDLTEDYWSILFNITLYHEIGVLDRESAIALITEPVKGYLRYDELAIDKLLRMTGQHPYFIQVACRLLVNFCNSRQTNFVTLTIVNQILQEAVEGSTAHVKYLFKDYASQKEQEIMAFLARLTDESKNFASITEIEHLANENGFHYDRKQIMDSLAGLKNKQLLKEGGEIRGELYGFEVELLRLWIIEHVSIQRGFISLM